jgi:hypothetical protein
MEKGIVGRRPQRETWDEGRRHKVHPRDMEKNRRNGVVCGRRLRHTTASQRKLLQAKPRRWLSSGRAAAKADL